MCPSAGENIDSDFSLKVIVCLVKTRLTNLQLYLQISGPEIISIASRAVTIHYHGLIMTYIFPIAYSKVLALFQII